ncbi:MAG: Flp pilus assembly protein CpaB [Eubacteriales bacterium]|nr:Flp pilus assembly protein CpaB [Eubacteriales bacterium]
MKKVKWIALLSAVAVGVLVYLFLNSLNEPEIGLEKGVVTASVNIPSNTTITESMVIVKKLPEVAVLQNSIDDAELVIGKAASSDIVAGEQLLSDKLVTPGDSGSGTLAYAIEPDMRAITISVDATKGLAGMLKPQNKVDIIGQFDSEGQDTASYATLVGENLTVLAVDAVLDKSGSKEEGESPAYTTITLQVTPKQALEISIAEHKGQLKAVLRSPLDEKLTNLHSVTYQQVMVK